MKKSTLFFCLLAKLFFSFSAFSATDLKLKIHNTTAEKWKAIWICKDDGSKIDADTYPASTKTARETTVGDDRCPSGDIEIEMYIKHPSKGWKRVKKGAGICTVSPSQCGIYKKTEPVNFGEPYDVIKEGWFGNNNKLCAIAWNAAYDKIYLQQVNCYEIE